VNSIGKSTSDFVAHGVLPGCEPSYWNAALAHRRLKHRLDWTPPNPKSSACQSASTGPYGVRTVLNFDFTLKTATVATMSGSLVLHQRELERKGKRQDSFLFHNSRAFPPSRQHSRRTSDVTIQNGTDEDLALAAAMSSPPPNPLLSRTAFSPMKEESSALLVQTEEAETSGPVLLRHRYQVDEGPIRGQSQQIPGVDCKVRHRNSKVTRLKNNPNPNPNPNPN